MILRTITLFVLVGFFALRGAQAAEIVKVTTALPDVAVSTPVLTIKTPGRTTVLTLAEIETLPLYQATMATIWSPRGEWVGVRFTDLLAAYDAEKASQIVVRAVDDYAIRLKGNEIVAGAPLLATRFNGQAIDLSGKGPLFLVWPSRVDRLLDSTDSEANWIWAVNKIETTD
jgi:hypothetical protein